MQRYSVVLAKFRENGHNSMVLMVLLGYLLYFGENVINFIVYIPNNICLCFVISVPTLQRQLYGLQID